MENCVEHATLASPSWGLLEFTFSDRSTDSELVIMCDHRRFVLRLAGDNFSASPRLQEKYLFFLKVAENFELDGYTVEDFYDWVAEPMLPIFKKLSRINTKSTLNEFLFADTRVYTIRADSEQMLAVQQDAENIPPIFGVYLPDTGFTPWPTFEPSEIQTCDDQIGFGPPSHTPAKVLLHDGTIAFLKLIRPGDKRFLLKEIETYRKIHHAHLHKDVRISRLLGLVRDRNNEVYGLLLTFIDCERRTLFCAIQQETPKHLRQRWATQVHDVVAELHNAGVVWGDAKPDNVLIDQNDNAWVIDFGGGYTDGWVPKNLAGTVEGDLQALGKINDFILM
jgi:serine/threonine protein kinase